MLTNGLLEELRPDETTDVRTAGIEKFLVFKSDRSFRLELDGRVTATSHGRPPPLCIYFGKPRIAG